MSIGGKIRFLLLLLGICCIITALSLSNSITKSDLLVHEAEDLQQNLDIKQQVVKTYLTNPEKINELKKLNKNDKLALSFIETYRENGINVLVYKNEKLEFWSSAKAFPTNVSLIKEGSSLKQLSNGYYELIKKTVDDYVIIFLISIKSQYSIENQYLKNQIAPELFSRNTLDLATFTDKDVKEIFSLNKEYLFTVKLTDEVSKNMYADIQLWLWISGLLSICSFVNSYCSWLAKRGLALSGTLVLLLFFVGVRLSDLQFFWFNHQFNLSIFSPYVYAQGEFLPSLGDLFLHVLAITWIGLFAYVHKQQYILPKWITKSKIVGILFHIIVLVGLGIVAFLFDEIFFGLINNSKINFDITNIISLGWISWVSILILCLAWFNIYLFSNVAIEISKHFNVTNRERLFVFIILLIGLTVYKIIDDFNVFFLVYAFLIFIIGWNNYVQFRKFSVGIFALIFLCMAFLTSIKYTKFSTIKEHENRRGIAEKLLNADDPKVINSIESFEKGVSSDSAIVKYFKSPMVTQSFSFHNYITKTYLDGYLSRFEYKMYEYDKQGAALKINEQLVPLSKYKNLVTSGAIKTQENSYSYRINDTFGFQIYFGIIPVFDGPNLLGTLVIELKSQPYDYNSHFPDLLIDGKLKSDEDFTDYSIAFYKDNKLYLQSGKYTYAMVNTRFRGEIGKVEFINDEEKDIINIGSIKGKTYNHAAYRPDKSKLIIISKEKIPYIERLATLSFFFLVFILFGIAVYILIFIIKNINDSTSGWFNLNRYLMINANKILYKTRIQVSIVLSVVATLLIVGWATFFYIKKEYQGQQENAIREKIRKVQLAYEKQISNPGLFRDNDETKDEFNQFADGNSAFLNLYDVNGNLWLTSLPKMFDLGIVGKKMGPKAFIELSLMQRSEFLNTAEKIGTFQYAAAYAPIRNAQNRTIAYIGMPYYANELDYQAKIGLFINTLINIYALVFVLIGVLAVFLANQITNPLTFIQENIRKTKLGQKNRPIIWHRQDEIGSLVKEYNKMIAALELSATKLARSERESAWREMAKQVAHEIKNPLTPLKLGVQLLEKSWKEGDPNFEKKFASFNKSFIEQIDSLATIASEFSNFAKMPDTKLEELKLFPIIEQAIGVFNTAENIEILVLNRTNRVVHVLGDKDQLLRTFNNLLKNAIEASEGKEKCIIKIQLLNDEKNVFVEVQDNGKGIDAVLRDKIFVPNFTTKSSGTGLGLAFVKQAIENAGGTIDFTSEINMGTTFNLSFPLV